MKAFGVLLFALGVAFAFCKESDFRCTWNGEKTEHANTCEMLKAACGKPNVRMMKCSHADKMVSGQLSTEDRKEDQFCYFDLEKREPADFSRCQIALWACKEYEFAIKKTQYAFVHPGKCVRDASQQEMCDDQTKVCPWTNRKNEKKTEKKKGGFMGWLSKQKNKMKNLLDKTKSAVKKEMKLGKVCTFDGQEFENRCEFMKARCKKFVTDKIVLAPAMKKIFGSVRKCTNDMSQNAERLLKGPVKF